MTRNAKYQIAVAAVGLVLTGAMAFSYQFRARQLDAAVQDLAVRAGRVSVEQVVATRRWNASMGGVYVPVEKGAVPNPYLDDPVRDLVSAEGIPLTKVNPAYMTRLVAETLQKSQGVQLHLTSLRPLNPGNAPDGWETAALTTFETGAPEASTVVLGDAPDAPQRFRYMAPLKVDQACLACHAKQGYVLGAIRGGVSVDFDYGPYEAVRREFRSQILLTHLVAFLIAAGALLVLAFLVDAQAGRPVPPPLRPPARPVA